MKNQSSGPKTLNPAAHDRWMKEKKKNRPKQEWVWNNESMNEGHWEKL